MTPMPSHVMPILSAHARLMDEVAKIADPLGLNPSGVLMIAFIGDQTIGAKSIRELGYYQGANASYNLKNLEAAGYINKQVGNDRRRRRISLTPKGRALAEKIRLALSCEMRIAA